MMPTRFDIQSLHEAYRCGTSIEDVIETLLARVREIDDEGIFLHLDSRDSMLAQARAVGPFDPSARPLWGIPFAIKDNIDAAGLETTAACPAFAYLAEKDAKCVALLREAGAILVGKTNLDQFATGLVGLRTPFPAPRNAVDQTLAPGGSSSGSAVAVAHGLVSFALGTDTAGSGRVPAALNNIVGLKPTLGTISSTGLVPACRTLDTVSILALTVEDAFAAYQVVASRDEADPFSRDFPQNGLSPLPPSFRVGVPDTASIEFCGDELQGRSFAAALDDIASLGGEVVELDFAPFYEIARMLYDGAWVAERHAVVEDLLKTQPESVHPVTRTVVEKAVGMSATDAFRAIYRLQDLKRQVEPLLAPLDMLCVPTIPTFYRVEDVLADPIGTNAKLGTYTNFVNLLDLCAIAVPTASRDDGLPGSVTLLAPAGADARIAAVASQLHFRSKSLLGATRWPVPQPAKPKPFATKDEIELAVVGAHMSGLPLNAELTRLGARFLRTARTDACYRLYALSGGPPFRPGLIRDGGGSTIQLETWALPKTRLGELIESIPEPLGIGTLILESREQVKGFLCEPTGLDGAKDITEFGGWRSYIASAN